jgi:hypothetical protein
MAIVLGYTDGVHNCDCCGKANLKGTFGVQLDSGDVVYYGSVCVTRNLGRPMKEIQAQLDAEKQSRVTAAKAEFVASIEHARLVAKQAQAHKAGLLGLAFKQYCTDEIVAARLVRARIAAAHKLQIYEV